MIQVVIIIPALNEAGNIARLVAEMPYVDDYSFQIIVVDNGSTDTTAEEALAAGAQVVKEMRRGYGYACAAGVSAIHEADIVVFMDADGSFDPAELPSLLAPIAENRGDLVLGSRIQNIESGAMPPHQEFGNRLVSWLMRWLYNLTITDLGPYRAIRYNLLLSLNMQEMTFGWPTEMIVKAARKNARILEIPVSYRKRWSGRSKVSGTLRGTILAGYYILGITLRYAFGSNGSNSPNETSSR